MLFSVAADEMAGRYDPSTVREIFKSEDRTLESELIASRLAQVEQQIDSISAPASLKQARRRESLSSGTTAPKASDQAEAATLAMRLAAGAVDLGIVIFISVCLATISQRGGLTRVLAELSIDGLTGRHYPFIGLALSIAPLVSIVYFAVCFLLLGASMAGQIFSFTLMTANGRPPRLRHIVVRAASIPLSVAIGGYIPLLFGKPALPDRLAKTRIVTVGE